MGFSENLQRCKAECGYQIPELSRRSGIPVGTLSKLLSGAIAEPKLSTALALAAALQCPLSRLVDYDGDYVAQTLSEEEQAFLADYRRLDRHSRELLRLVLDKQLSLCTDVQTPPAAHDMPAPRAARVPDTARMPDAARILAMPEPARRAPEIPLYDMPVSAGTGVFLDSDTADMMPLPDGYPEGKADFALRVSGQSMEPRFHNGDILLVHRQDRVEVGELGIFLADGEGYFKRFMGDCMRSLNPAYADIPLAGFRDVRCCGKVVGRLAKKN